MKSPRFIAGIFSVLFALLTVNALGAVEEPSTIRVAGLKVRPVTGDKSANFETLWAYAKQAKTAGATVVVTPECFLDGYAGSLKRSPGLTIESLREIAEPIDGSWIKKTGLLARELDIHILLGFSERRGSEVFNSAAFISPDGKVIGTYSKSHLGPPEVLYSPGGSFPVFRTPAAVFGSVICFDRQLPEPTRILATKGVQILLIPAYSENYSEVNEDLLVRIRAYENGIYVVLVGINNACVAGPDGEMISLVHGSTDGLILADLKLDERVGNQNPYLRRRPGIYGDLAESP
jgi:predicted amidohydrolase